MDDYYQPTSTIEDKVPVGLALSHEQTGPIVHTDPPRCCICLGTLFNSVVLVPDSVMAVPSWDGSEVWTCIVVSQNTEN